MQTARSYARQACTGKQCFIKHCRWLCFLHLNISRFDVGSQVLVCSSSKNTVSNASLALLWQILICCTVQQLPHNSISGLSATCIPSKGLPAGLRSNCKLSSLLKLARMCEFSGLNKRVCKTVRQKLRLCNVDVPRTTEAAYQSLMNIA
jgi:hypothetical protein